MSYRKKPPTEPLSGEHGEGCACWRCIDKLQVEMAKRMTLQNQIDAVTAAISDFNLPELLGVLTTLQWVRDNEKVLKQRMSC